MQTFERIYFIREFIKDYSSIVAMFLQSVGDQYKIIDAKDVKKGDLLGLTFFSINSYPYLKRLRKAFPDHEIIVGGIGVYSSYNRILEFANYVYFGEGFQFDIESVLSNKFEKEKVKIQNEIDFKSLPLVRIGQNNYYFQIEKGCPYRCEYCYVSWVNVFRKIDDFDFRKKIKHMDKTLKGKHITFVGNEGLVKERNADLFKVYHKNKYDNQSITLKNYLANYDLYKNQSIVRFGVELPTEKLRTKHLPKAKHIKDSEILEVLTKKYNKNVQFFYIWNYLGATEKDYHRIHELVRYKKDFLLRLNFTTLEIQPYTRIVKSLGEHAEQLLSTPSYQDSDIIKGLKRISKVKVFPAKRNSEVLKCYLFSYTNLPLKTKVSKHVINKIVDNAGKMKKNNNFIQIIKF